MSNYHSYPAPAPTPEPARTLARSRDDKMIAGVCGGLARYLGVDATLVRLVLVAAVILGFGTGFVLYALGWLLMPQD